jgi:UDP-2,4-diacetamido-2,4,6-trideoxy-beta-L-altropyranose hydrolase
VTGIKVLFRLDAGPGKGLGHLQRCLSLASVLRIKGADCIFLSTHHQSVTDRVKSSGFGFHPLDDVEPGGEDDLRFTLDAANSNRCRVVVVDFYDTDAGYLKRLRADGLFVAAIDDLAPYPFPCHLVINGGVGAGTLPYSSSTGDTRFLLGPEYALLREEFWDSSPRAIGDEVQEVLVTMGGADGRDLTPTVLEVMESTDGDFGATVIVGPFFKALGEIEQFAKRSRRRVNLVHSPVSVRDLMAGADLAISAAGQTLYELAVTGTPAIAVQVAENQADNIRWFGEHRVVCPIVFESRAQLMTDLADTLTLLLTAPERRRQSSRAGQSLLDGHGGRRVADFLLEAVSQALT